MATTFTAVQLEQIRISTEHMFAARMFWFNATGSHSYYDDNVKFSLTFLVAACTQLSKGLDPLAHLNAYFAICNTF